jgi:NADH dehydrogenase FAD-containing subunit
VEFEDGSEKEADVVIWCGGIEAPEIVQKGFETGGEGLEVNRGLSAVDFKDVYAVGKCADIEGSSRASEAVRQGRKAAVNIGRSEGLLEDYESSEGFLSVSSPGSGVLLRGETVLTGRSANFVNLVSRKKYFTGMWRRRVLNSVDVLDPLLEMMDGKEKVKDSDK